MTPATSANIPPFEIPGSIGSFNKALERSRNVGATVVETTVPILHPDDSPMQDIEQVTHNGISAEV